MDSFQEHPYSLFSFVHLYGSKISLEVWENKDSLAVPRLGLCAFIVRA